jgi:hypothetical protein
MIQGIPATDDQDSIVATAPGNRIFVSSLTQDYSLVTALDTITWKCVQDGAGKGAPGAVNLNRNGDYMTAQVIVAQSITQARNCTGFSSFTGDIEITPGPVATEFTFPVSDLEEDGYVNHTIDETLPCGEWTIFQTACDLKFRGTVSIRRMARTTEDKPKVKSVTGTLLPKNKGAKVKVSCTSACSGQISATAVAKDRLKAKKVGQKSFNNSSAGPKQVEMIFGTKGSRAVRRRGAVIIDVRSGGQSKSVRLNAR